MSDNEHGLDSDYFEKKLRQVAFESHLYTPEEMARELLKYVAVASGQNHIPLSEHESLMEKQRGELAKLVPSTWLDSLLTGKDKVITMYEHSHEIRALLLAIKERLLNAKVDG